MLLAVWLIYRMRLFCRVVTPPPLDHPPLHHQADCVTEKTVRCLLVNHCMDVSITTGKCRGPRGCETLWPPPHLPPLKNSCCDLASSLFCEQKPIAESWKNTCRRSTTIISREINSPSVTYGHGKSVFKSVFLFNCIHSNFSEILGPWEQINGEKTKQNKSTSIKYDVISLSLCQ